MGGRQIRRSARPVLKFNPPHARSDDRGSSIAWPRRAILALPSCAPAKPRARRPTPKRVVAALRGEAFLCLKAVRAFGARIFMRCRDGPVRDGVPRRPGTRNLTTVQQTVRRTPGSAGGIPPLTDREGEDRAHSVDQALEEALAQKPDLALVARYGVTCSLTSLGTNRWVTTLPAFCSRRKYASNCMCTARISSARRDPHAGRR